MPRQAKISNQRDRDKRVAQQTHEHGGPAHGVEILALKDIDESGGRERAGSHRDPDQIEDDPESPGVSVRKVRATTQAQGESGDEGNGPNAMSARRIQLNGVNSLL